jgi:hypothetical protein
MGETKMLVWAKEIDAERKIKLMMKLNLQECFINN